MPKKSYAKTKGRGNSKGHFLALYSELITSPAYNQLSAKAVKLLVDIGIQYRGSNNGNLTAAIGHMKKHGWQSEMTLRRAIHELETAGFIEKTRQGSKRICNLYALTWQPVDDVRDKNGLSLLDGNPTKTPSNKWKKIK